MAKKETSFSKSEQKFFRAIAALGSLGILFAIRDGKILTDGDALLVDFDFYLQLTKT